MIKLTVSLLNYCSRSSIIKSVIIPLSVSMARINPEYRRDAKKKIIDATIEVVSEKGATAVTLEDIAQKVGVTKGALYTYFESREVLFREMVLEVFTRVRSELKKVFQESDDGPEVFSRITDLMYGDLKRYTNIFSQMVTIVPQDPELQALYSTMFDKNVAFIGSQISRMQKKGAISAEVVPEEAARAILALVIGLLITELHLKKDHEQLKRICFDSVSRLLSLKTSTT